MSRGSTPGSIASPACRWSRAPRVGSYDPASGRYTLYAGSGGIVRQKRELAAILGVPEEAVRVIAREIGGNFGTRNSFFPEFALVAWGSRPHRAAGEMDLRTPGGIRQRLHGPRSYGLGRTRARRRRPLPRTAQLESQQCRRPLRLLRAAGQRRGIGDGRLPHPARGRSKRAPYCRPRCAPRPIAAPGGPK